MNQQVLYGRQLMFDEFTNNIVEEPLKYWKTMDNVPKHIKDFILNTISSRIIYDSNTKKYHCSKCLKCLDSQYYCSNCAKQCRIAVSNNSKYVIHINIEDIKEYDEHTRYFVFDIVEGQILLYMFNVYTYYYNSMMWIPCQINKISIEAVYHIIMDGITNLLNNTFYSFEDYCKEIDENYNCDLLDVFEFHSENHYLYTDNLDILRSISLYKYTNIWELKDYYEKENFDLASLTCYPIYFKQFEYLVKMKLYRLAATGPDLIKYNHNFKDTFGVDKKYYSFMKAIDIDCSQLHALQLCPTTDIELVNFIAEDVFLFEELSKYVKADKIKDYLEKQRLDYHNIHEYYDYIKCCEYMSLDMKDKQVLFPKEFIKQHDKITRELVIATDSKTNKRIKSLSNILALNTYEDDKYVIFPANSVDSLINESSQMSNCVRNYCVDVSNNKCQIYFMRYKENVDKSLVTIEVRDGKIVQARTRFNKLPTNEMNDVLKKWEKQIIPIINE